MREATTILKVLVGSRAHGLAREGSDYDYRGVFVLPTSEILSLGARPRRASWVEKVETQADYDYQGGGVFRPTKDDTSWEVGHFLDLATRCNPSVLEVLAAPVVESTPEGERLRAFLPCVWHPRGVRDAFVGYGLNQRKKFLEDKDGRPSKYACAYLRVLYQADQLLRTGRLPIDVSRCGEVTKHLRRWREGYFTKGEVVDVCLSWQRSVEEAAASCEHEANLKPVNEFLLDLRRQHWDVRGERVGD